MRPTHPLLLVLPLSTLGGCFSEVIDDTGVNCSTDARASLQLSIVREDGVPVVGATGSFTGGGFTDQACDAWGTDESLLVCGWEVQGDLAVEIEAEGFEPFSGTWTVPADACHVQTVQDTVVLVASPDSGT